jgi:hypothetical protein
VGGGAAIHTYPINTNAMCEERKEGSLKRRLDNSINPDLPRPSVQYYYATKGWKKETP